MSISTIYVGLCSSLLHIGLHIKVGEHRKEHRSVEEDDVAVVLGEITVNEKWEGSVHEESCELHQLHGGQISRNDHNL